MNTTTTLLASFTAIASALVINVYGIETKDVGEVYTYSYKACAQYTGGAKGVSHCAKYVSASEQRIDTVKEGRFFNLYSYRVVK
jgi:hypothetical protein